MTDFDANHLPTTDEEWASYAMWCHEEYALLAGNDNTERTYHSGFRAAAMLLVAAAYPLSLAPDHPQHEVHTANLRGILVKARCIERHHGHVKVTDVLVARAVSDCFRPVGTYAGCLLEAVKCALGALILVNSTILTDPWDVDAPDVWGLALLGGVELDKIPAGTSFEEFAVAVSGEHVQRMQMDRANQIAQRVGAPMLSPN